MLSRQEELIFSEYSLWTILHADAGAITIFAANALLEARHFFLYGIVFAFGSIFMEQWYLGQENQDYSLRVLA